MPTDNVRPIKPRKTRRTWKVEAGPKYTEPLQIWLETSQMQKLISRAKSEGETLVGVIRNALAVYLN